jgi:hypothetical protein
MRVMTRLNMTLDLDTERALVRYARKLNLPMATAARQVLSEGLAHRDQLERQAKLARDYAEGAADAVEVLEDLSDVQHDWND